MSKRLEELLKKYEDENEFHFHHIDKENIIFPAMIEYAREVAQASLERAADNAKIEKEYSIKYQDFIPDGVDKESITNPDNIALL